MLNEENIQTIQIQANSILEIGSNALTEENKILWQEKVDNLFTDASELLSKVAEVGLVNTPYTLKDIATTVSLITTVWDNVGNLGLYVMKNSRNTMAYLIQDLGKQLVLGDYSPEYIAQNIAVVVRLISSQHRLADINYLQTLITFYNNLEPILTDEVLIEIQFLKLDTIDYLIDKASLEHIIGDYELFTLATKTLEEYLPIAEKIDMNAKSNHSMQLYNFFQKHNIVSKLTYLLDYSNTKLAHIGEYYSSSDIADLKEKFSNYLDRLHIVNVELYNHSHNETLTKRFEDLYKIHKSGIQENIVAYHFKTHNYSEALANINDMLDRIESGAEPIDEEDRQLIDMKGLKAIILYKQGNIADALAVRNELLSEFQNSLDDVTQIFLSGFTSSWDKLTNDE